MMICIFTAVCFSYLQTVYSTAVLSSTEILLGNTYSHRAEVYQISFQCDSDPCVARKISPHDLLWASAYLLPSFITEVKRVVYSRQDSILVTQDATVYIFAYPSGDILFNRTLDIPAVSIHSAEVLPDGNVAVVVSTFHTVYILKPCRNGQPECENDLGSYIEANEAPVKFGHGLVFDRKRNKLIVLGYLDIHIFTYHTATNSVREYLSLDKTIRIDNYYIAKDHDEDFFQADGGHDLYPMGTVGEKIFVTTGERVFTLDVASQQIRKDNFFYYLNSQHSHVEGVEVVFKSGVKSISHDSAMNLTLAHAAPWFKELYNYTSGDDNNYPSNSNNLIWSVPEGRCAVPDFDTSDDCKINFEDANVSFYKARLFHLSGFSYDLSSVKQ